MKFDKIKGFMQPNEQAILIIKPNVRHAMRYYILIAGITCLTMLLPLIYFLFTDLKAIFFLFIFPVVFTFVFVTVFMYVNLKNTEYVITENNLYAPSGKNLIVFPLKDFTILNENKIRAKKPKVYYISTKAYRTVHLWAPTEILSDISWQNAIAKKNLQKGKFRLHGIMQPEFIVDILLDPVARRKVKNAAKYY